MKFRALGLAVLLGAAPCGGALADSYGKVVSAIAMSFDDLGDVDPDRAVLVVADHCARFDLYIYLADRKRGLDWDAPPTLVKQAIVEPGGHCVQARLEPGEKGAFKVVAVNNWVPPPWSQTLTIVHRDGEFLVAAESTRGGDVGGEDDGDHPPRITTCEADYLAGKGARDGKPFAFAAAAPKLARWGVDPGLDICAP